MELSVSILIQSQIPCHTDAALSELFVYSTCDPVGVVSLGPKEDVGLW